MHLRAVLGELLPVIGTIGLLGLWTFQQTGLEARSSQLRRLAAGRAVYQNYQSNNALFNAIIETVDKDKDKKTVDQIRRFQMYNYELGLKGIEDALPASALEGIPPSMGYEDNMDLVQSRLEKLQERLTTQEDEVKLQEAAAKRKYMLWYIGLSVMALVGAILKALDKLMPAATG